MQDPAEEFDALRGGLKRATGEPVPPHQRWDRRPSYDQVTITRVPDAARFSDDHDLGSAHQLIVELQAHEVGRVLDELTRIVLGIGRTRQPGSWISVFLFYVLSVHTSMKTFYTQWRRIAFPTCGFGDWLPAYNEMALRFGELEECWEAFVEVVAMLVALIKREVHDLGLLGFIDATAFLSPHAVLDACTDLEACKAAGGPANGPWKASPADAIEKARAIEAEIEPPDDDPQPTRTRRGLIQLTRPSGAPVVYRRFFANGHWGHCLDLTVGFRRYDTGASWLGGLCLIFAPTPFGVPLAINPVPADIQEWDAYPPLYDLICRILGHPPLIVSTDRGLATKPFYLFNTLRRVAVAGPRRLRPGMKKDDHLAWRHPQGLFDEDGIPRCEHCSGPGQQDGPGLGLYFTDQGEPRIRFRCLVPLTTRCGRELQSQPCQLDPVSLIPGRVP